MSETVHPWCRDVSRDEAIRAAEDAAAAERTPLPDYRDLPAAVAELRERVVRLEAVTNHLPETTTGSGLVTQAQRVGNGWWFDKSSAPPPPPPPAPPPVFWSNVREGAPPQPAPVPPADGLRTERVRHSTASIDLDDHSEAFNELERERPEMNDDGRQWASAAVEAGRYAITRLTAERDAAIRERDAARADAEHDVREVLAFARLERDAAREECERLRIRVAELESAPAANAGGEQPPRGWLTPNERKVLTKVADEAEQSPSKERWAYVASCVRALLARSTPPKVEGPTGWAYDAHDMAWIAAIREAGGEVAQ